MNETTKYARYARVAEVFTPGAPINTPSLFAGRLDQVLDVLSAVAQRGQHVMLYGERGVGKTSLANVIAGIFQKREMGKLTSVRVNCDTAGSFASIWAHVFRELGVSTGDDQANLFHQRADPEDVRYALAHLSSPAIIIIDELDRLEDDESLSLLSDTLKTLSDHSVAATLVLVGVADSVEELVGEHRSMERAVTQIQMPRMSRDELSEIIDNGVQALHMTVESEARTRVARLSEGLPYYTHLLSLHAAQRAVTDDRSDIQITDVLSAIRVSLQKAQHSVRSAYQIATRSPRTESLFEQVLLACALAPKDDLGYFTPSGIRHPMSRIMGKPYQISAFARHLGEFNDVGRGAVLQKVGQPRRYFYRFENPLLQPFVILNGLERNLVSEEVVAELQQAEGDD